MLLLKKGWHEREIAEAMGVHERTVRQWKQHQRDYGTEALLRDERGRQLGDGRKLTAAQEKQVREIIADKLPEQLKLAFALWTRRAVAELLKQRFDHSKLVKAWLAENLVAIAVYNLPSYSPELNPDEHLNRALKSKLSHLPAARDERSLQKQIIGRLRSCQRQPSHIRSFFTSSYTQYAA
jgi:transposase